MDRKLPSLYKLTDEMINLQNLLDDPESYDENGEILPVLQEQLNIVAQDFNDKAIACTYITQKYDDDISAIDNEIKRLTELKRAKQRAQDRLEDCLITTMNRLGIKEVKSATRTLKLTESVQTDVYSSTELPTEYKRTEIRVMPDKNKIKDDIKNGVIVPGAKLVTNYHLKVK